MAVTRTVFTPPLSNLLNSVVNQFDNRLPNASAPNRVSLYLPDLNVELQRPVRQFLGPNAPFPDEIKTRMITQVGNVAEFITISHIFNVYTGQNPALPGIAQESAKTLLKKFGHATGWLAGHVYTPVELLFSHVYLDTMSKANDAEKRDIIRLTRALAPLAEQSYTTLQKIVIQIEAVFSWVAGNFIVRWAVAFYVGSQAQKVYRYGVMYFRAYVLPRGVNFLINHASLKTIRVISTGMAVTDKLLAYQGMIWFGFFALSFVPQLRQGMIGRGVRIVETVLLLPNYVVNKAAKIPSEIYSKVFSMSSAAQQKISRDIAAHREKNAAALTQREFNQAYRIYMQCVGRVTYSRD